MTEPVWPLLPTWTDILGRLAAAVLASALLGLDRSSRGHAAGLRTMILVGLAAAAAMIQANLLLGADGKTSGSFATLDLMRMPLGILTGVGFIGGGVILKHRASVTGVTTAATLWIVTAVSLAFGGGQFGLGIASTAIAMVTLFVLKPIEDCIPRRQRGQLEIFTDADAEPPDLGEIVPSAQGQLRFAGLVRDPGRAFSRVRYEVQWAQSLSRPPSVAFLGAVRSRYRIASFEMDADRES